MTVRRAKIIATLGPSTDGLERQLVATGLDVARLNFSHGTPEQHAGRCAAIRAAAAEVGRTVAILQDLQGPKIRVGLLAGGGPVALTAGQTFTITTEEVLGTTERVSCTYTALPLDVSVGDRILLDDGRIRLRATSVEPPDVHTIVEEGGLLGEQKGINLPGVRVSAPALTEKDRSDLRFGLDQLQVDYVALSFIRTAAEVREARALVAKCSRQAPLVVKLEKPEAIDHLEEILDVADAVMVARGDLGVELPPEQVPVLQKRIIRAANARGIPVVTATQMLESMIQEETPTRAEATDVANAVWDGTDALMLSAETAAGRNPLRALEMMDRVVRAAEGAALPQHVRWSSSLPLDTHSSRPGGDETTPPLPADPAAAITRAAAVLAEALGATGILAVTGTGRTAELLARIRPVVPVYVFATDDRVCRRLALWWGVTPIYSSLRTGQELAVDEMEAVLRDSALLREADTYVVVGVHPYQPGQPTNFLTYRKAGAA